jgi:hypothetical protein
MICRTSLATFTAIALMAFSPVHAASEVETKVSEPSPDQAETEMMNEPENALEVGEISGADEYYRLCSSCHGEEGRGDGPIAASLKTPPPNLTVLAKNNDGHFPFIRVLEVIDGRGITAAHGPREMPVWGESLTLDYDQFVARTIELELLLYLNSIQVE